MSTTVDGAIAGAHDRERDMPASGPRRAAQRCFGRAHAGVSGAAPPAMSTVVYVSTFVDGHGLASPLDGKHVDPGLYAPYYLEGRARNRVSPETIEY